MSSNNDNKIIALEYIKDMIITCALPPGADVPVDELAAQLHLSKTPVREALLELEYENYVTVIPRKKTVVSRISLKDLEYIYEARSLNEIAILASLTAPQLQANRPQLQALLAHWQALPTAAADKDAYMDFLRQDTLFHIQLVNLSPNPHLVRFCTELIYKSQRFWYMALFNNQLEAIQKEHLAIIEALLAANPAAAAALAQKHITLSKAMTVLSD